MFCCAAIVSVQVHHLKLDTLIMNKPFNLWLWNVSFCFISYRCFNRRILCVCVCVFLFLLFWLVFFLLPFVEIVVVYHTIKALTVLSFTTDIISPYQNQYSLSTCLALFVHKKAHGFFFCFPFHHHFVRPLRFWITQTFPESSCDSKANRRI